RLPAARANPPRDPDLRARRDLRRDHGVERRDTARVGRVVQDPDAGHLRGVQPGAARRLRGADPAVLGRARHRALPRRGSQAGVALTILCVSFAVLLLLSVPVAFAIGLSAVCTILWEGLPLAVVCQLMNAGMNIFSFLAIPFFIFAGELMLHGGIADRIVAFAKNLVGHIRGGLGMSNVVACTLFGGVSGSAVADVSAMGAVMIPMMKREGYHADYAVNVTTHAALVGVLMPTSHNMIIYSLAAGGKVSIAALILAGVVPAVILTLSNLT